jgi:hypothetical protein
VRRRRQRGGKASRVGARKKEEKKETAGVLGSQGAGGGTPAEGNEARSRDQGIISGVKVEGRAKGGTGDEATD